MKEKGFFDEEWENFQEPTEEEKRQIQEEWEKLPKEEQDGRGIMMNILVGYYEALHKKDWMEVNEEEIMNVLSPFLCKTGSVYYLPNEKVNDAIDRLYEEFNNIFTEVKDYGKGITTLIVGKMAKVQMRKKQKYLYDSVTRKPAR